MNVILYDRPSVHLSLYPLTLTRPVSGIRVGILTIAEKWNKILDLEVTYRTEPYLQELFSLHTSDDNWIINSSLLPDDSLVNAIKKLPPSSVLVNNEDFLAVKSGRPDIRSWDETPDIKGLKNIYYRHPVRTIRKPWDLFLQNGKELINDFILLTGNRVSNKLPDPFTRVYNERNLFIEEGVSIKAAILNAENGPVYLGKNVVIQEGAAIHGPAAFLEGSVASMGVKIREDTTIGPYCKIGGEVKNSIFFGNSNKAHEGYLGNSVIGEWCNLGADTINSNLKNNYSNVRVWDYESMSYQDSGQQFCGVFMGDHSKTAIGTRINTGTVIGVSANVFGHGLTPKFIPSFSWGGYSGGSEEYDPDKAIDAAKKMMSRRNYVMSKAEEIIMKSVFTITGKYRQKPG